jgi:hypothetical protein
MECQKTLETRVAHFGLCGESSNVYKKWGWHSNNLIVMPRAQASTLRHSFSSSSFSWLGWVGYSVRHDGWRMMASSLPNDSKDALSTGLR